MLLAFILCFSTLPMTAFAQEAVQEADVVTEQEKTQQEAGPAAEQKEAAPEGKASDTVKPTAESVSDSDAGTQNTGVDDEKKAAVQKVQALINALPEEVTAENADELQTQLMAIDKAMEALNDEQRAELDMTRLENIQAALNGAVAVQDAGHTHTNHPVCGDVDCQEHGGVLTEWKALSCDEDGTLTIDGAEWKLNKERYYLETGNYYLAGDLNLNNRIVISGEVNLCLNGFSITQTEEYSVISYQTDTTTFSLCDCKKSGVIRGNASRSVVYVYETFNMYGGTISGGAVGVEWCYDGCFNMYGGKISGNTTGASQATCSHDVGIFNMYGGEICNNKGSGVKMEHLAKFNMYGGEICNNEGSGVYITQGYIPVYSGGPAPTGDIEFNMSDGKITGNNTATNGGGVYMKGSSNYTAKVNMSGGEITGNNADTGGGVYVGSYSTFTMSGGEITGNNTATNGGGNVYVADGTFSVSDTAKIQNNWIGGVKTSEGVYEQGTGKKSNVYLPNNKKITIGELGLQTGASIGVTYGGTVNADTDATIATGANNGYSTDSITSDDGYRVWKVDDELRLTTASLDSHPICGKECTDGSHSIEVWKGISDPTKITSDGNYYLTSNVDLTRVWHCKYNVKLCLNGFTITGASGEDAIVVSEGYALEITDCKDKDKVGKITHNESESGKGIKVYGTLTLWNGTITGNNAGKTGGGVYVSSSGSFTMKGGTITGNSASDDGGGVYVSSTGSFTMKGGTISENNAGKTGGGVYVSSTGSFTMTDGSTITGNNASTNGGGVYVFADGSFTMTDGSTITGNNASTAGGVCVASGGSFTMNGGTITGNNASTNGGGVYVYVSSSSKGKLIVSGEVQITNNWKKGTLDTDKGIYLIGDGEADNVYLFGKSTPATITIEEGLSKDARIGVRKSSTYLADGTVFKIATGATGTMKYTEIFTSDVPDKYFITHNVDEGNLYLGMHQHSLTYTKGADDKTITATCDEAASCPNQGNGGSVTIAAPDQPTYDGSAKKATVSASDDWLGNAVDEITITYKDESGNEITEPINAGTYTASITLGDATASVTYKIEKATPTAGDFTFTAPNGLTYNGEAKKATVVSNKEGMGTTVSVKYYQDEKVAEPVNAGEYTVKIDVTEGANYNAAKDLTSDSWRFTIERSSITPKVELSGDMIYNGNQITPDVTVTIDNKTLTADTDYTIEYGENITAGENAGSVTIKAATTGNYAFADVIENFDIEKAEQTLRFEESNVTKTFIDKPFSNLPIQVGDGTVTYSSSNTNVATVNKTTGEVTIVGVGTATITATAAATTNYKERSASYTLTVNKALLVVNRAPVVQDKYYDGTADAVVTVSFADGNNALLKLKPTTDYTVTGTFSSPNASTSKQEVSIKIELKGDYAKNYELKKATYTAYAYIHAKPISIVSATAVGREYVKDNRSVTISSVEFDDVVTSLVKDTDYTVTGVMADADAGTKNVTVKVTLRKEAANNYIFEDDKNTTTTTVEISKATPVITAATWKTLMNNGIAVDISNWADFDNTDDNAKLSYKLWDGAPAGVTLDEKNNMLKVADTVSEGSSFAIEVTAEATTNFEKPQVKYITVQVVNKIGVEIDGEGMLGDKSTVTYGDPDFSMTAAFKDNGTVPPEGDNGTWNWSSNDNNILEIHPSADGKTAKIHIKNAGTTYLTVTYSSDTYVGTAYLSITVNPKAITVDMIGNIDAQEYTGKDIVPTPEVKDGTTKLTSGTDFTYSYSNNRNAGTATLTITGKGNYEGEVTKEFTISPKSIDGASIELANKSFAYTGSEQTVNITSVKLSDGTVLGTDDYVIKDNSNKATNAGEITLTIEGKGNYTGTATTTWEITKIAPVLANFDVSPDLAAALTYDGTAKTVTVTTADSINGMGEITVKYNGSTEAPTNAGRYEVTFEVADGTNYNAKNFNIGTLTINKAAALALKDMKEGYKYTLTGEKTVKLADLVAGATGYTLGAITGDTGIISNPSVDADGVLKYTLTGKGKIGDTVTLPVTITSVNYEDTTVKVVITLKAKDDQAALSITGDKTVVYGKTLTLGTTGGSGTGKVTYSIDEANSTGEATIDANGVLTPVKVGSITVKATKAGDADYNEATSAAFIITITKAGSTGEPKYAVITTEGKTLANAGLTLTGSTLNPTEGTLKWVDEAGNELSDDTKVEVNTTYKWCFTPADTNYDTLTGEVELWHVDAPAISAQPKNVSVITGEKATFEVTATGTDVTYQWQIDRNDGKGFVDITGATGATYTTGVTDKGCDGFKYQCVIRNAAGSVTTDTAVLTVKEKYIITASAGENGSISPNGAVEVVEGSNQTFVIAAEEGYEIESLTVDGTAVNADASYTFENVTAAHTIAVTFKQQYKIIEGANGSWTQNTDGSGSIKIRGNGGFSKFRNVMVDGNIIDPSNYTASEGSTIIELHEDYLKTLSEGIHTLAIVWTDGSASTNFMVAKNTADDDDDNDDNDDNGGNTNTNTAGSSDTTAQTLTKSPKTGDASGLWIALFAASAAGLAVMLVRRKKY